MAKTLEETVKEHLGQQAWVLLCQQQRLEAQAEELAALKAALARKESEPS